jgi:hypothetical protein
MEERTETFRLLFVCTAISAGLRSPRSSRDTRAELAPRVLDLQPDDDEPGRRPAGAAPVYHCVDDVAAQGGMPVEIMQRAERRLVERRTRCS